MNGFWVKFVRFGFRLLYNEMAWSYDIVSWAVSLGHWSKWQRAALPFVQGKQVLEIGHGPGHLLVALKEMGHDVVGLDLSPYMGQIARKKVGVSVLLVRASVQELPWNTAVFDTILSTFPTDYIVDPDSLSAIHRVLRENGRLIIVPEGHLTGQGIIYKFIQWLFKITGQTKDPFDFSTEYLWQTFTQPMRETGFVTEIHTASFKGSEATVILAIKQT